MQQKTCRGLLYCVLYQRFHCKSICCMRMVYCVLYQRFTVKCMLYEDGVSCPLSAVSL